MNRFIRSSWLIIFFFVFTSSILAQKKDSIKRVQTTVLPVLGFAPETSLSFGVAVQVLKSDPDTSSFNRPSSIQALALGTLNKQFIFYSEMNFYIKKIYHLKINVDFIDFPSPYFGLGIHSSENSADLEGEEESEEFFTPFQQTFNPSLLREINAKNFVGLTADIARYEIFREENQQLEKDNPLGLEGGGIMGIGLQYRFDSRDDVFYPSEGFYFEGISKYYIPTTWTPYEYVNLTFNAKKFWSLNSKNILAFSVSSNNNFGNVPFFRYEKIGGANGIRGIHLYRFLDKYAYMGHAEYRRHIWKRLAGAAFMSFGQVTDTFKNYSLENTKVGVGIGLRYKLTKKEKLNIRVDYAIASDYSSGFYVSVGEAF